MLRTLQTASAAAALNTRSATSVSASYIAPYAALEDVYAAMTPRWRAKAQQIAAERARFSADAVPALHNVLDRMPTAAAADALKLDVLRQAEDGTVNLAVFQLPALGPHLARVAASRTGELSPTAFAIEMVVMLCGSMLPCLAQLQLRGNLGWPTNCCLRSPRSRWSRFLHYIARAPLQLLVKIMMRLLLPVFITTAITMHTVMQTTSLGHQDGQRGTPLARQPPRRPGLQNRAPSPTIQALSRRKSVQAVLVVVPQRLPTSRTSSWTATGVTCWATS